MLRGLAIFTIVCCNASLLQAQPNSSNNKLSASLKLFLSEKDRDPRFLFRRNGITMLSVFIEVNDRAAPPVLTKQGCVVRTVAGDVLTADIPIDNIYSLAENPLIKRIELPLLFRKTDTIMRNLTQVEHVLKGELPLDKPYTGKNVVIGVVDDGVDFTHADFYNDSGLRIKKLWNMDYSSNHPPAGFSYGTEWNNDSMLHYAALFKQKKEGIYDMQKLFGYSFHGTSVTSLAAGNNGVAIDAEIVCVAFSALIDTILRSDRIIDGIAYIYSIAKAENKKCIINLSVGTMDGGPHDGKTLVEKAIDNFCYENPDILVCVSAGNNGNDWKHWGGFPINKDSSFGFFQCTSKASLYFSIPKQYSKTLNISVGESKLGDINSPNISRDSVYFQTPFLNIDSLIQNPTPVSFTSHLPNGNLSSYIIFTAAHYNDDYDELILTTDEHTSGGSVPFDPHLYRFILKGSGTVHAWYPFLNLHPIFWFDRNPYPGDPTYHGGDNDYSTIIPTNAFTVISSGAYNLRTCYVNMKNKVVIQYEKCRTTYFTSHGPTLDGRIKPDVISPGENVFAALTHWIDYYDYDFVLDSNTVSFAGTSASSPITAGIAALIWEKYPLYTRDELVDLIKTSAYFDSYCATWGSQPNNIAGWGKTDAFFALTGVRIDTPLVCDLPDACITKPEPSPPPVTNNYFNVYPNPVTGLATISYYSEKTLNYYLYDALGRLMQAKTLPLSFVPATDVLDMTMCAAGIYFLKVSEWDKPFVKKIVKNESY